MGFFKIAAFFALVAAICFAVDKMALAGLRRVKTCGFGVSNKLFEGRINADVVISGSSRALVHYDPRVIQAVVGCSAFNIGLNGSQTDMQVAVLSAYLKHNKKPSVVLHNLDSFSFVATREVFDPAQYLPYLDDNSIYNALREFNPAVWKCRYIPLYGFVVEDMRFAWLLGLQGLAGRFPREDRFLGFNPRNSDWSNDFDRFRAQHPQGVEVEMQPRGVRAVEELIRICGTNAIPLILVYSPEYGEMQALTQNRKAIFNKFRQMSGQSGVAFWDFSDWEYSMSKEYFQNSQHLNARGAEVFSQAVARRLKTEMGFRLPAGVDLDGRP